jgi:DNA modification methylase
MGCMTYWHDRQSVLYLGDVMNVLPAITPKSIDVVVTSPPYFGLRDSGWLGAERTVKEYADNIAGVFAALRPVMRDTGVVWLNIGDSYNTYPANRGDSTSLSSRNDRSRPVFPSGYGRSDPTMPDKNLLGVPWAVAARLREDGWIWRNTVAWVKTQAMPSSAKDRLTCKWEPVMMFACQRRYSAGFNLDAARSPGGGNPGDVWVIPPERSYGHPSAFPVAVARAALATAPPSAAVLDPFCGSGSTGVAAAQAGLSFTGIDIRADYLEISAQRIADACKARRQEIEG